ncbi:Uncharacterised protein [Chryseobacterium nakagawai]|uniref:Uncharacterized protein n=1 Tax=Chryseobacterium nakagawai TaxID=1241982 RepID=A0AAD0YKB1_CHRNA|nr:hypothetical protein [Chryseobacterium nakagawai]AZA90462.1 hypothetical protein EG343_07440 [Chryseobacterium nakagawai]VEH21961.1 Uncharacterised protein [Chryseobacterium nakagawai]
MSAKMIFFTTPYDEEFLTEEEALEIGNYRKQIWINNALKKEESYRENQLWGGVYYLSPEENVVEILIALGQNLNWTLKDNEQKVKGYTVWDCKFYNALEQAPTYSKIVLDADGKKIATITHDSLTHQVKGGLKTYEFGNQSIPWGGSDDVFDEDSDIVFIFGEDGEVDAVHVSDFLFSNDFTYTASQFFRAAGNFFKEMGLSDQEIYYYTHAEPLVPNF